jgi:hypothetical protein
MKNDQTEVLCRPLLVTLEPKWSPTAQFLRGHIFSGKKGFAGVSENLEEIQELWKRELLYYTSPRRFPEGRQEVCIANAVSRSVSSRVSSETFLHK